MSNRVIAYKDTITIIGEKYLPNGHGTRVELFSSADGYVSLAAYVYDVNSQDFYPYDEPCFEVFHDARFVHSNRVLVYRALICDAFRYTLAAYKDDYVLAYQLADALDALQTLLQC